jgi:hypothetical protein
MRFSDQNIVAEAAASVPSSVGALRITVSHSVQLRARYQAAVIWHSEFIFFHSFQEFIIRSGLESFALWHLHIYNPKMAISVILEFARTDRADDPFAFRFAAQEYLLRSEGGSVASSVFPWQQSLLEKLEALRGPQRDPVLLQQLGRSAATVPSAARLCAARAADS